MSFFLFITVPAKPSTLKSVSSSSPSSKSQTKISTNISPVANTTPSTSNHVASTPETTAAPSPITSLNQLKLPSVTNLSSKALLEKQNSIDIHILREKSKNLDLPLISALCNDRSLLKQTKAFVMPKHPRSPHNQMSSSLTPKAKYPVSGLSTTQIVKPRKTSVSHRHPNDKLPPLPIQAQAEGNNYVMDPTPIKHKSFNSQPASN